MEPSSFNPFGDDVVIEAPAGALASALAGGAAVDAPAARPEDCCPECGERIFLRSNGLENVCPGCGCVLEAVSECDEAPQSVSGAHLRIVGPGSPALQKNLYGACPADPRRSGVEQVARELAEFVRRHMSAGRRGYPEDVLYEAATLYKELSRDVQRSLNKRNLLASCMQQACLRKNIAPHPADLAALLGLPTQGIARGSNRLRTLKERYGLDIDIDVDPCGPLVATLFEELGLTAPEYLPLRDAVLRVVAQAKKSHIATSSVLRSKVSGATYAVVRRSSAPGRPESLLEFCARPVGNKKLHKNTVQKMVDELEAHHSLFEAIYAEAGLDPRKLAKIEPAAAAAAPKKEPRRVKFET